MANCELCGLKAAKYDVDIEGTLMNVCDDCARFGKVKHSTAEKIVYEERKRPEVKEPDFEFVQGYGAIVKRARERLGLKQEEMAKKLNVRESLLHQIESEHFKPNVELAKKIEKALHIHIIDELKSEVEQPQPKLSNREGYTLGDMINRSK